MSKLYNQYMKLKNETKDKIYLFKSGIFYICLDEDAKKMSELFSFKITSLNENVVKCGFPVKRLSYYLNLLEQTGISFQIVDNNIQVDNLDEYVNNNIVKSIIKKISNLQMDEISYKESFELLYQMHNDLNILEKEYSNGK